MDEHGGIFAATRVAGPVSLPAMTCTDEKPRWAEGSTTRVVHALVVWLAFLTLVHAARLFLFPSFGFLGGGITFVICYGGILWFLRVRVGGLRARDLGLTLQGWPKEVMIGLASILGTACCSSAGYSRSKAPAR